MVSYENVFPGVQYTTMMPSYYTPPISGYQASLSHIGMALDARTANQLGDLNIKLNPGQKVVEIQGIQARTMESIPEQHLDEIRRLTKLVGAKPTLHGPMLDASGIVEQSFSEENRIGVERQIESTVLRAQKLDPEGNIPVTFHSTANLPELRPHTMETINGKRERVDQGVLIIDEDTGRIQQIKPENRYFPEEGNIDKGKFTEKKVPFNYKTEIKRINSEQWTQNLSQLNFHTNRGEDALSAMRDSSLKPLYDQYKDTLLTIDLDKIKDEDDRHLIDRAQRSLVHGQGYYRDSYRMMKQLFDKAWSNVTTEDDKKKLKEFAEEITPIVQNPGIEANIGRIEELKNIVDKGYKILASIDTPQIFKPLNEFVIEKSAETFANVAAMSYSKFKEKAPIISIENPPGGGGLSTAEDIIKLIEASRERLADNLVEKQHVSRSEAQKVAEKMIGATWDVGHINMLRKKGYSEKEVIEQTKKIAPLTKHVHLSDNFGLDHTELPMGMGNVPLKPMMDELKKAGFKGEQIVEAGNWWEFFSTQGGGNPFLPSIEGMNSPMYAMAYGPTWSQAGRLGMYYAGHGPINPAVHHNLYGTSFQNLPLELGGEIPGDRGRFAGAPNQ